MYCKKCGKWNEKNDKFCYHCGTPLKKSRAFVICLILMLSGSAAGGIVGTIYWKDYTFPEVITEAKEDVETEKPTPTPLSSQTSHKTNLPDSRTIQSDTASSQKTRAKKQSPTVSNLEKISRNVQNVTKLSGKLASYKSVLKGYTLFYPEEWKNRISITETENSLCIISKDMEDCASDMEYEQGYWRHSCYLLMKIFYAYSDADDCFADCQNPDLPMYTDDLLFKRNPARNNFHQVQIGQNTYVAFMEDNQQQSERWLEFEGNNGYDAELFKERALQYKEIVKNLEILKDGFVEEAD